MPRKPKPEPPEEASEKASEEPGEEWLTTREARMRIGNISPSKWERVRREFRLEGKTDEFGVLRYPAQSVDELADKLGLVSDDVSSVAMQTLRETIDTLSSHIKQLHGSMKLVFDTLLAENSDIRKLRAEEQAQHLKAILATQEALDLTAERKQMLIASEAREARMHMATHWIISTVGPEIIKQWRSGQQLEKVTRLVRGLDPEQFNALKVFVPEADQAALEELRNARSTPEQPQRPTHPDGDSGGEEPFRNGVNVGVSKYMIFFPRFRRMLGLEVRCIASHTEKTQFTVKLTELSENSETVMRQLYGGK